MGTTLVTILHVLVCLFLVGVILIQQGKGADAGATFGGGSNTLFGASGADTFLVKVTTIAASIFMLTSIYLAIHQNRAFVSEGNLFQGGGTAAPEASAPVQLPPPAAPQNP